MNMKRVRGGVVCALLGLSTVDHAQGQAASAPAAPANAQAAPSAQPPPAGSAVFGVSITERQLISKGYRASKLLKVDVYNDKGEKIGKVDDILVSPDGTLSIAVLNVGPFIGIPKRLVAIPVRDFAHIAPKAMLPNASKEQLKGLPKFEYTS